MKRALLAAILVVASSAGACINDRDTLAFELRNVDALKRVRLETDHRKKAEAAQEIALKAIGGRFERFPPKYYEMRIARLEALPSLTAFEYDDLAVAYERLGKTDKAIDILLASKPLRKTKDDKYRFHANYGTFLVHKWLAQKDRKDTKALKQSIDEIEAALRINPSSHFGRESVQLELEKLWLSGGSIPDSDDMFETDGVDTVVGLSGIVMMGLAYELPDAYFLMGRENVTFDQSILRELAWKRTVDLIREGHVAVSPSIHVASLPKEFGHIQKDFSDLRADGERVHQARLGYIEERLNRGEHPDTHENFWNAWKEPPVPILKRVPSPVRAWINWISVISVGVGGLAIAAIIGLIAWKLMRRNRPPSKPA